MDMKEDENVTQIANYWVCGIMGEMYLLKFQVFEYLVPNRWGGLGGVTLLERACHWGKALRFQELCAVSSVFSLFHVCNSRCEPSTQASSFSHRALPTHVSRIISPK